MMSRRSSSGSLSKSGLPSAPSTPRPSTQIFIAPRLSQSSPKPVWIAEIKAALDGVVPVRGELVHHLVVHHQLRPRPQPAGPARELVGRDLDRAVVQAGAADAGVGEAGDALRRVLAGGLVDGAAELLGR